MGVPFVISFLSPLTSPPRSSPAYNFSNSHLLLSLQSGTFSDTFHKFGLVWTSQGILTYVDDPNNHVLFVPFNVSFWQRGACQGVIYVCSR